MKSVLIWIPLLFIAKFPSHLATPMVSSGGTKMVSNAEVAAFQSDDELQAARAAILVLKAISREEIRPNQVRILPDGQVRSNEEAAVILSRMEKPLQCRGASTGGVLSIGCEPVTDEYDWLLREQLALSGDGELGRTRASSTVIAGREESITLSASATQRLDREYLILGNFYVKKNSAARAGVRDPAVGYVRRYVPSSSQTTIITPPRS